MLALVALGVDLPGEEVVKPGSVAAGQHRPHQVTQRDGRLAHGHGHAVGRGDQGEGGHPVGTGGGEQQSDGGAERGAQHVDPVDPQVVEQADQVVHVAVEPDVGLAR